MPGSKKSSIAYFILSIAVTIGIFYYLLSHVSLSDIFNLVKAADRRGVTLFLILSITTSYLHMCRFRLLLNSSGFAPNSMALFLTVLVRNLFSDLLPARAGTLIYVYIAASRLGVTLVSATSSFTIVFLFDAFAIFPLVLVSLLFSRGESEISAASIVMVAITLGALTLLCILKLPQLLALVNKALFILPGVAPTYKESAQQFILTLQSELRVLRAAGIFTRVFILSLLVRLSKYLSLYVFLVAMLMPEGYSFVELPFPKAFIGLCAAEFAASLPISGIGALGLYEGTWAVVFNLLGLPQHTAIATGIGHHLFTQIYGYSLGGIALLLLMLPVFYNPNSLVKSPVREPLVHFVGRILIVLSLVAFSWKLLF